VPANVQPHPLPLVPAQQDQSAFRVDDQGRAGEVQRQ